MTRKLMIILACIVLLSFSAAVSAVEGPKEQIKEAIDKVLTILKDNELKKSSRMAERRTLIRKEVGARFDFAEMSKRALGMHWQKRTPEEKKEFVSLFSDLLEKTYINKIEGYSSEKIVYEDQVLDGDYATVKTRITTTKNVEIPIVYRMLRTGSKWSVYDVVIEEVSLISNYRTQFNKIIKTGSYEELIRKMKGKQVGDKATNGG
jgi:phospholipid transport system substrate-binding protein